MTRQTIGLIEAERYNPTVRLALLLGRTLILDLATGGLTPAAFRSTALPVFVLGVVIAGEALIRLTHLNSWLVAAGGFVVLAGVVAVAVGRIPRGRS